MAAAEIIRWLNADTVEIHLIGDPAGVNRIGRNAFFDAFEDFGTNKIIGAGLKSLANGLWPAGTIIEYTLLGTQQPPDTRLIGTFSTGPNDTWHDWLEAVDALPNCDADDVDLRRDGGRRNHTQPPIPPGGCP
jgi:hypothetical protein